MVTYASKYLLDIPKYTSNLTSTHNHWSYFSITTHDCVLSLMT